MGSCYSHQAHNPHRVSSASYKQPIYMPTTMSSKPNHHPGFGFRRSPKKTSASKTSQRSNEPKGGAAGVSDGGGVTDVTNRLADSSASRPKSLTASSSTQSTAKSGIARPKSALVKTPRFGFLSNGKTSKENLKTSSDSIASAPPKSLSGSQMSVNSSDNLPKGAVIKHASFKPKTTSGSWRMIDDESRSTSAHSALSTSTIKAAKNIDNKTKMVTSASPAKSTVSSQDGKEISSAVVNETPDKTFTQSKSCNAISSYSNVQNAPSSCKVTTSTSSTFGIRPVTRMRGPLAKFAANHYGPTVSAGQSHGRAWVKASSAPQPLGQSPVPTTAKTTARKDETSPNTSLTGESQVIQRTNGSKTNTDFPIEPQTADPRLNRSRISYVEPFSESVPDSPSQQNSKDKSPSKKMSSGDETKSKSNGKGSFSVRGFFKRSKTSSGDKSAQKGQSKEENETEKVTDGAETPLCDDVFGDSGPSLTKHGQDCSAPIAVVESVETLSVSSLKSDDLMLDFELTLDHEDTQYEEKDAPRSRSNSLRYRRRPRSRSRDRADNFDRRPSLRRKESEGQVRAEGRRSRLNSEKNEKVGDSHYVEGFLETESVLEELATLQGTLPHKPRNPRIDQIGRPNSFPGPKLSVNVTKAKDCSDLPAVSPVDKTNSANTLPRFKPPRQAPSITDDEEIVMDGFMYRQLIQEITSIKTSLLRFKRLFQEDDIGAPWKNGMVTSHPSSPCWEEVLKLGSSEPPTPSPTDKTLYSDLMQENTELRQRLEASQLQIEQQDKSIKLLQSQMTKYECGHLGPGGKSYKNSSTQTDMRYSVAQTKSNQSSSKAGTNTKPLSAQNKPTLYQTQYSTRKHQVNTDLNQVNGLAAGDDADNDDSDNDDDDERSAAVTCDPQPAHTSDRDNGNVVWTNSHDAVCSALSNNIYLISTAPATVPDTTPLNNNLSTQLCARVSGNSDDAKKDDFSEKVDMITHALSDMKLDTKVTSQKQTVKKRGIPKPSHIARPTLSRLPAPVSHR